MNILVQFLESEVSASGTKQSHDLYLQQKDQEGITKCPLPFGKPPMEYYGNFPMEASGICG